MIVYNSQKFKPSYNILPTNTALIIYRSNNDISEKATFIVESLTFGLVPLWAHPKELDPTETMRNDEIKDVKKIQSKYFNCRKESLLKNSSVWSSAKNRRCVIPIQGYFEWMKTNNQKIPYFVHSSKNKLLFLAGLYSHNRNYKFLGGRDNTKSEFYSSFTVITGPASKSDRFDLSWLHDRKPIIIEPGSVEWDDWLNPNKSWTEELVDTCLNTVQNRGYDEIESYRVTPEVVKTTSEGEHLLKKMETKKSPQKSIHLFFKSSKRGDPFEDQKIVKHIKQEEDNSGKEGACNIKREKLT